MGRLRSLFIELWLAARRSHKDQRSRTFLLVTGGAVFFLCCYAGWLGYVAIYRPLQSKARDRFAEPIVLIMSLAGAWIVRWRLNSDENQPIVLGDALRPKRGEEVSPQTIAYLRKRLRIIASLAQRAASEIGLHTTAQSGIRGVREEQNTLLRQLGLWDDLEPGERELVSSPDGAWTDEQRSAVPSWLEQLRLLRWVLGIDGEIAPLNWQLQPDFALIRGLNQQHFSVAHGWADIALQRDIAAGYAARIAAEQKYRSLENFPGSVESELIALRDEFTGDSTDLLVGTKTIKDLDNSDLSLHEFLSWSRFHYAGYLLALLETNRITPFSEWGVEINAAKD